MNKGIKVGVIVILSILFVGCTGLFIAFLGNNNFKNFSFNFQFEENQNLVFEKEYGNDYSSINVVTRASDVKYLKSENENVLVRIYGENDEGISVEDKDGKLVVYYQQEEKKSYFTGFNVKSPRVEVYVPSNFSGKFDVNAHAGDVKIGSFKNVDATIKCDVGDVKATRVNSLDVTSKTGDVKVGSANDVVVKGKVGDIKIDTVNHAVLDNKTGDVKIENVLSDVKITGDVGDVKINKMNLENDSNISINTGDIYIEDTNEIYFDTKTNVGDVKINNNYRDAKIVIKLKTNIGDIKVNN